MADGITYGINFPFRQSQKGTYLNLTEETGDETRYYGTIFVPDLVWEDGKIVDGEIEGYICKLSNHQLVPYFDKGDYNILEFCNGLEYELDNFLEYVVNTLEDEKSVE